MLLARAICQEPEVIILDEPTSFLDVRHKLELLAILRSMAKEKKITVIMSTTHEIDLAQKIADKIICVKRGNHIPLRKAGGRFLKRISYGNCTISTMVFSIPVLEVSSCLRPEGKPEVFVMSACGTGIPVYRRLQKENTPFAAGILYTNDVDYQLARLLAMEVVTEEPFHEISNRSFERALDFIKSCKWVIDAGVATRALQ